MSTLATTETIPFVAAAARKYGPLAAIILCLIRYRCQVAGADRIEDAEGRMWRATGTAISDAVGASPDAVQRATKKLVTAGALVAEKRPTHYGDHTLAYRVVPDGEVWAADGDALTSDSANLRKPDNALTCDSAKSRNQKPRNRGIRNREIAESSISQEVRKKGEEGQAATASAPTPSISASRDSSVPLSAVPELSRHCSKHPNGTTAPCGACGEARKAAAAAEIAFAASERDRAAVARGAALEARRNAISACRCCDEHGYRLDNARVVCNHVEDQLAMNVRGMAAVRSALATKRVRVAVAA